jgi:hypothetical protein
MSDTAMRRALRRVAGDDGRVALLVLVMALGVLAMIGLSVDGGGKMRALKRADRIAAEAARAAGQAIDFDQAVPGGEKVVDPGAAVGAAQAYLAAAGVSGSVSLSGDRRQVSITVSDTYNTVILGIIGIGDMPVTGHATAQLLTG